MCTKRAFLEYSFIHKPDMSKMKMKYNIIFIISTISTQGWDTQVLQVVHCATAPALG